MRPLEGTVLPERARARIAASLEAARLSRRDRDEVAAELAGHLEDGIESGRDLDDLLRDFGEPGATGALIGRSMRRKRRAHAPALRAAQLFGAAVALVYVGIFARLHGRPPERSFDSPSEALAAWASSERSGDLSLRPEVELASFDALLASMYTPGEDGHLTASGLRIYQAWKSLPGRSEPGLWAILLEPAYFPSPARRGEVRREFERFLRLAGDTSGRAFEAEREALRADSGRSLRFVALQIPLERLASARAASRRSR